MYTDYYIQSYKNGTVDYSSVTYEQEFRENFKNFKEKKILLYGAGQSTKYLIPKILDYKIVGIVDRNPDKIGTFIEGVPVIGIDQITNDSDCIIINVSVLFWKQIVKKLKNVNIPIYYNNGHLVNIKRQMNVLEIYSGQILGETEQRVVSLLSNQSCIKEGLFSDWESWGYCLYGPIIWSYFHWLAAEVKKDDIEQLWFLARDGYLLIDEYDCFCECNQQLKLPKAIYFPASRRMTCVAAIDDEKSFKNVMSYAYNGTFEEFCLKRFHIKVHEYDVNKNKRIMLPQDSHLVYEWLQGYQEEIRQEIEREKQEYLSYIYIYIYIYWKRKALESLILDL